LGDAKPVRPRGRDRYSAAEHAGDGRRISIGEIAGHFLVGVGTFLLYWYGRDKSGSGGGSRW